MSVRPLALVATGGGTIRQVPRQPRDRDLAEGNTEGCGFWGTREDLLAQEGPRQEKQETKPPGGLEPPRLRSPAPARYSILS